MKTERKCIIPWHCHAPPEARRINYNEYDSSLDIFSFRVVMVQMVVKAHRIACSVDRDVYIEEIKNAEAMSPLYTTLSHVVFKQIKTVGPMCKECCWIVHVLRRLCVLHNIVCDYVLCM